MVSDDVLEGQNDGHVQQLGSKIAALKSLTIDIGNELRTQNTQLDQMDTDMSGARGLLNGTMQRLTTFSKTAHGKQIMYLTAFALVVFFVLYLVIR